MQSKEKIYGIHAVLEALNEGLPLNKVLIQRDVQNDRLRDIIQILKKRGIPFQLVPKEKLNRLTSKQHQGIIALGSPVEYLTVSELLPMLYEDGETPLLLVLDGVTDVRNVGAIARSAECFGAHGIVVPAQGSALLNADAMKSSAGALLKVPVCREINFSEAIKYMKGSGLSLMACTEKATQDLADADFSAPLAIVMGAEGEGIHPDLLAACDQQVRIPMTGEIGSLNVSVAAGVILYEAQRQRR